MLEHGDSDRPYLYKRKANVTQAGFAKGEAGLMQEAGRLEPSSLLHLEALWGRDPLFGVRTAPSAIEAMGRAHGYCCNTISHIASEPVEGALGRTTALH